MRKKLVLLGLLLIMPLLAYSCALMGIEKPTYQVVAKEGKFEVRQYEPQIIAETIVESDFDEAGNIAFRRLFDYISGRNRGAESIKMTAPVNQKADSQKIAMTAPVNQRQAGGKYAVSFIMPSKYTLETLPEPVEDNVTIRQIPARKMAAIRYSGSWGRKKYEAKKTLLEDFIERKGLTITGADVFARYDPPFQLWFFRRNEVLFPVE